MSAADRLAEALRAIHTKWFVSNSRHAASILEAIDRALAAYDAEKPSDSAELAALRERVRELEAWVESEKRRPNAPSAWAQMKLERDLTQTRVRELEAEVERIADDYQEEAKKSVIAETEIKRLEDTLHRLLQTLLSILNLKPGPPNAPWSPIYDALVELRELKTRWKNLIDDISYPAFEDERLSYVEVQISPETWVVIDDISYPALEDKRLSYVEVQISPETWAIIKAEKEAAK